LPTVAVEGDVTLIVVEESVLPGEIVTEVLLKLQVNPEGHCVTVKLKIEFPHAALSLFVTLTV
jgi:hypothetical protein